MLSSAAPTFLPWLRVGMTTLTNGAAAVMKLPSRRLSPGSRIGSCPPEFLSKESSRVAEVYGSGRSAQPDSARRGEAGPGWHPAEGQALPAPGYWAVSGPTP